MTLGVLQDMGYEVNTMLADPIAARFPGVQGMEVTTGPITAQIVGLWAWLRE